MYIFLFFNLLQYLPKCRNIERIVHLGRAEDTEIPDMFCDLESLHDHGRALELWEDILFADEY